MLKIGILTFHNAINYGALLQAYALKCALAKNNDEVYVVDYANNYIINNGNPFKAPGHLMKAFKILSQGYYYHKKEKACNIFIEKYICPKKQEDISLDSYDIIVVGSDQVWNTNLTNNDMTYYLKGVNSRKIAYAASFGDLYRSSEKENEIMMCLKEFEKISVREKYAQDIINTKWNISSEIVPDPVFLLERNEWEKLIFKNIYADTDYVLVYTINKSDEILKLAKRIAEEEKIRVIYLNQNLFGRVKHLTYYGGGGPLDFISLIYYSKKIITNSFHATSLSIIFGKQVWSEYETDGKITNNRIYHILNKYEMLNNSIKNYKNTEDYFEKDYSEERKRGLGFLNEHIK